MAHVGRLVLGVGLLLLGAPMMRYARPLADVSEQLDAVGSRRPMGSVEAADWAVTWVRALGGFIALFGFVVAVVAVLP